MEQEYGENRINPDTQKQQRNVFYRKSHMSGSFVEHDRDLHRFTCGGIAYQESSMTFGEYERFLNESGASVCVTKTLPLFEKNQSVDVLRILSDDGQTIFALAIKTEEEQVTLLLTAGEDAEKRLESLSLSDQVHIRLTGLTYLTVRNLK